MLMKDQPRESINLSTNNKADNRADTNHHLNMSTNTVKMNWSIVTDVSTT